MSMGKVQYLRACNLKFMKWKSDGLAPATRAAAVNIISKELNSLGYKVFLKDLKKEVARSIINDESEIINDRLAFAVWDLTINSGKAVDYSVSKNYFAGLFQQIGNIIYTNSRISMAAATGKTISMPTVMRDKVFGAIELSKVSPKRLSEIAEEFIIQTKITMLRWKAMGADPAFIIKTLKKLEKEILATYNKNTKLANLKKAA